MSFSYSESVNNLNTVVAALLEDCSILGVGEEFELNSDIGVTWVASWDDD
jgi:hypothetical protein